MSEPVVQLLNELEAELKALSVWSASPPDPVALASTSPFCCDVMPLEQWLQYLFLPRMRALIAAKRALPTAISVLPIAEEAFKHHGERACSLLDVIGRIDITLTGR